jgi:hypothetical protein
VCNDCNCEDENIEFYKCPGRSCVKDTECQSGNCQHHYCTVSKTDFSVCTKDNTARCGRCPETPCTRRKQCQYFGCLSDKSNPLLPMKCSACECFFDRYTLAIKSKMCGGMNCEGDDYCESGVCVNGICTISKNNSNLCTTDVEAACGKCDKVRCDQDQGIQC